MLSADLIKSLTAEVFEVEQDPPRNTQRKGFTANNTAETLKTLLQTAET